MKHTHFIDPLKKAKGAGKFKHGLEQWKVMRITSVFLIVLTLWFFSAFVSELRVATQSEFVQWMARPWNAVLLSVLILVAGMHSYRGLSEVVEDYVQCTVSKISLFLGIQLSHLLGVCVGVFCVLSAALRG